MVIRIKKENLRFWCWALMLSVGCATSGPAFAQGQAAKAELESVFKDWQDRQRILKSARYVLTGETEFKDDRLPPGSPIRPRRMVFLLDLARKRYRLESSEDVIHALEEGNTTVRTYHTRYSTSAYDGEALQSLRHNKANNFNDDLPDLSIGKGNLGPGARFGAEVWPVFMAHGIVPTVHAPLFVDRLPLVHDPDDFDIAGWQLLSGQRYLLVRTEPFGRAPLSDEFWIDPQQKSTIHRHVYFSGSYPWTRLDIFWKNTAYGWWVDHWSETWSVSGHVRRVNRCRVESFEADPQVSDGDFTLAAEPGMKVTVSEGPPPGKGLDPFKAAMRTYRISPSGSWDEISAKGFTTVDGRVLPVEGSRRWIAWSIGVGVTILALLFYALRRRKKKAAF